MSDVFNAHELCVAAREAARIAGEILVRGFSEAKVITSKGGNHNLVTQFDVASEQAIIECLLSRFPGSSVLAEESGGSDVASGLRWIIDPLDGTVNFAHGIPIFCVSIAAEVDGVLKAGVVYQPLLNEMFHAVEGHGAWCNDVPLCVTSTNEIPKSFLVTGFPYSMNENTPHTLEFFSQLVNRGVPIRRLGSAAIDLAYVAAGRFDGFYESALKPWDVAAGTLLVREAGGCVTTMEGAPFELVSSTILATNGAVHDELLRFFSSFSSHSTVNIA